ncbi:Type 1 glutamine amidotransferase-like domain-containing protein [Microbacterium sp. MC2]
MSRRTILATCTGWISGEDRVDLSPVQRYAVELTGVTGRRVRVAYVNTAGGDQLADEEREQAAARKAGVDAMHVRLFGRTVIDLDEALSDRDLIWVGGGSVANLLSVWRRHGLERVLTAAWERGVVLAGTSAGAICWHRGGPTSSFGELALETDALGLIPGSLGVHYDSQPGRRPLLHDAVARGILPDGFGLDEGTAVRYDGTAAVEFLTESPAGGVHRVSRAGDGVVEERMPSRLLPGIPGIR